MLKKQDGLHLVKSCNDVGPCYNILSFLFRLKSGIQSSGYEESKLVRKLSLDKEHFNVNVKWKLFPKSWCPRVNYINIFKDGEI